MRITYASSVFLQLLRKISTSKQLFVQRLDEDEDEEEEQQQQQPEQLNEEREQELQVQLRCNLKPAATNYKQYNNSNHSNNSNNNNNSNRNNPQQSVQYFEFACEATAALESEPEAETQPELDSLAALQSIDIQFDLVHYKENVRYLRHTPSNSNSNSSCSLNLQLEQAQPQPASLPAQALYRQRCSRACSVSVGSQFDGNYHNVIIMEQPPNDDYPIVKWDINGNSLEEHEHEEHFDLRRHWDAFDSRWRQLQSQSLSLSQSQSAQQGQLSRRLGSGGHSHSQSQRSSHHSSSCTLETWIDDAETSLWDDSQNLLQIHSNHNHSYNNNNSNCNQCLKSF